LQGALDQGGQEGGSTALVLLAAKVAQRSVRRPPRSLSSKLGELTSWPEQHTQHVTSAHILSATTALHAARCTLSLIAL